LIENIGERIKELRSEKELTLTELGMKVNLSASHLSQIEHNKTVPSLPTLIEIAKALDVEIRYFFETDTEAAYIKRATKGNVRSKNTPSTTQNFLTPESSKRTFEVSLVTLQPQTNSDPLEPFFGEEFYLVTTGNLTIHVGEEKIDIGANDSVHIDAYQSRSWSNTVNEPCVFIWGRVASFDSH
jgi:transcriptional regulator with XRE-family HTH domain